jgi:hypothetical protein
MPTRKGIQGITDAHTFSLNEIGTAVRKAETPGQHDKVLLASAKPENREGDH